MKSHTELLNYIADKISAETYLEIGVSNPAGNFDKIMVEEKIGVDPDPKSRAAYIMTSDEFFEQYKNDMAFDLIFIDGLHHADQVKRDIINAWDCLIVGGAIVIHDCNPPTEHTTHVPRATKIWHGNVYLTVCQIVSPLKFTIDMDEGCCVIRKGQEPLEFKDRIFTWKFFNDNRKALLNLYTIKQATERIDKWT